MYHNALDEFASWSMVLTTAQVIEGIRGILAAVRSDASLQPADVTEELIMMLARDDSNPEPMDVAVYREIEDWVVENWQEDSPELVDAMSALILTCGMTRGMALLEKAAEAANDKVRTVAQDTLAEAARDRLKGWKTVT
jgi:hypothetical protein